MQNNDEKFYGIESPSESGIYWGSDDIQEAAEIAWGIVLWKKAIKEK